MEIIKRKAELVLSAEEKENFIKAIKVLNQITDKMDEENLFEVNGQFFDDITEARWVLESLLPD